jgi:FAD/FMN-containing dehydrogenase
LSPEATRRALAAIVGEAAVLPGETAAYLADETEGRGLRGHAEAVVLPATSEEVASVVACCYEHDLPIVPRGGGSGFTGGAVPVEGGVVLGLERLDAVRSFDPGLWRMQVEAGVRTATVRRLARESGLLFPPDPGAAEQSQIGGNVATNAGGPHAFKYGVTGAWVTGLEAVVPPGEVLRIGGPIRKDVAGYDLRSLLIGSEGTLGVITAAWLRLLPAPEMALPVVVFHPTIEDGCEAIVKVLESGLVPAALEFADAGTLAAAGGSFPG